MSKDNTNPAAEIAAANAAALAAAIMAQPKESRASVATGIKGVRCLPRGRKRFIAYLSLNGRTRGLGAYVTLEEAAAAVRAAEEAREAAKAAGK